MHYTVETEEPLRFSLSIRIPGWAASATVGGRPAVPGTFFTLDREWKGKAEIDVFMEFKTVLAERPGAMYCQSPKCP